MTNFNKYLYIIIGLAFAVILSYLSYVKNSRDNALNKLDLANKRVEQLQTYIEKTNQQLKAIQQLDKDYQEKLRNAQAENDRLRDDLVNNVKRVYVKASCPVLPTNTATTSSINAATPRLTGDTRQDYLRLRLKIKQITNQVEGLQSYINNVCLK